MKRSDWHSSLAASLVSTLLLVGACGGDSGSPGSGGPDGGNGPGGPDEPLPEPPVGDYVFPEMAYTGFDGTHEFKVPIATGLTGTVTWEVEDPTVLSVAAVPAPPQYADYGETWAMVTTKKAGTSKVTAISGDKRASGTIVVAAYDAAAVTAGETRYKTPENAAGPQRSACVSCHGIAQGVDHSPLQMAFYEDASILSAITTGKYPGDDGYVLEGVNHAWNVTPAEQAGIVPYLRSLPPKGF